MSDQALREQLAQLLRWEDAHPGLERIVEGVPPDQWGTPAAGLCAT